MGIFIVILLLLFVFLVLWPVIKVWMALRSARNRVRDFFGQKTAGASYSGAGHNDGSRRRRRGKIIDPSVGEYVEFEEIAVETCRSGQDSGRADIRYETEEQVTDVEWEDIDK